MIIQVIYHQTVAIKNRKTMGWASVQEYLRTYNVFSEHEQNEDNNDEDRICTQIISTRIYLILLFTSLGFRWHSTRS